MMEMTRHIFTADITKLGGLSKDPHNIAHFILHKKKHTDGMVL